MENFRFLRFDDDSMYDIHTRLLYHGEPLQSMDTERKFPGLPGELTRFIRISCINFHIII